MSKPADAVPYEASRDFPRDSPTHKAQLLAVGLICSIAFLAVSRSALVPESVAYATPLVAAAVVTLFALPGASRLRLGPEALPVFALVLSLVVSTGLRGDTTDWAKACGIGALWVIAFLTSSNLNARSLETILHAIVVIGLIQVVIFFFEAIFPIEWVRQGIAATSDSGYVVRPNLILGEWTNRAQGTIGYPIAAGNLMAVCFALTLAGKRPKLLGRVILSGVFVFGALMTGTRSALIAMVVAVLVLAWLRARSAPRAALLALAATFAIGMSAFLSEGYERNDFSFLHRLNVLLSLGSLLTRPLGQVLLGSGLNSHVDVFTDGYVAMSETTAIDNAYLMTFITAGLIGIFALVFALLRATWSAPTEVTPALFALATFFFSYDALWWHLIAILFWFLVGASTAYAGRSARLDYHAEPATRGHPAAAGRGLALNEWPP